MKKIIPIPSPAWAKKQLKELLEANFKNNPAKLREATEKLISAVPPSEAKLQLILIATGEVEPSIDALVDGLVEAWGAL